MKVPPGPWIATKPNKHGAVHIRTSETPPGAVAEVLQFDSRYSAVDTARVIASIPALMAVIEELPLIVLEKDWPDEVEVLRAVLRHIRNDEPLPTLEALPFRHPIRCEKAIHDPARTGYLHGPDDDGPYDVDGVLYCGRCHYAF